MLMCKFSNEKVSLDIADEEFLHTKWDICGVCSPLNTFFTSFGFVQGCNS